MYTHTHTHTHTYNIPVVILKITWKDSLTMLAVVNSGIIFKYFIVFLQ